jgi:hypothetical protein
MKHTPTPWVLQDTFGLNQSEYRILGMGHHDIVATFANKEDAEFVIKCVEVCTEIQDIMKTYRDQESRGYIDTPGGLEHMGDVWTQLAHWDVMLSNEKR